MSSSSNGGWGYRDRPAPTVTGGGGKASGIELFDQQTRMLKEIEDGNMEGNGRTVNPNTPLDPIRVTPQEAAALQSYPQDFVWCGAKTKQYLQIGNAVPVLLAQRVLEALWATPAAENVVALQVAAVVDDELGAAA